MNDLADAENLAFLLNFDTVYGRHPNVVRSECNTLLIDGRRILVFSEADLTDLPFRELQVHVALECTGAFRDEKDLTKHSTADASYVVLSAPTTNAGRIPTVVHGVNTATGTEMRSCAGLHHQLHRTPDGDRSTTARRRASGHDYTARLYDTPRAPRHRERGPRSTRP